MRFQGISVSGGLAAGQILKMKDEAHASLKMSRIENPDAEVQKLDGAFEKALGEIEGLAAGLRKGGREEEAAIFDAHALMLQDPELIDQTKELIRSEKLSAIWALSKISEQYAESLAALDDAYLKERAHDVRDAAGRVLDLLSGTKRLDLTKVAPGTILVSYDITPSQMAVLDPKKVVAIVTEMGGKTSHTAILARSLEIPAVAGVRGLLEQIDDQKELLVNGETGEIWYRPEPTEKQAFLLLKTNLEKAKSELQQYRGMKSETKDGHPIRLAANIGTKADVPALHVHDAEGVGLYRTEFVFLDKKSLPSEEEQFEIYRDIFGGLNGKHCIIRTLDIGGDKKLEGLSVPHEENPFLGLRAVRLCLQERAIFKDQLRAILRAAHGQSVGIMIPMISNIDEILEVKKVIKECEVELEGRGQKYNEKTEFGVMIEVPSAGLMVDLIARHVDFVSVGTNDLTQYVCAVDRLNDRVEKLYDSYNPGFLRMMNLIFSNSRSGKIHSGICGSLAHSELHVPLFIGMGVEELSMTAQHILPTRKLLRSLDYQSCRDLVPGILACETSSQVKQKLRDFLKKYN